MSYDIYVPLDISSFWDRSTDFSCYLEHVEPKATAREGIRKIRALALAVDPQSAPSIVPMALPPATPGGGNHGREFPRQARMWRGTRDMTVAFIRHTLPEKESPMRFEGWGWPVTLSLLRPPSDDLVAVEQFWDYYTSREHRNDSIPKDQS